MDDMKHERRPRASLRGKGREILLGQQNTDDLEDALVEPSNDVVPAQTIDPTALTLTPDEKTSLLGFDEIPLVEGELPVPMAGYGDEGWEADSLLEPEQEFEAPESELPRNPVNEAKPLPEREAEQQQPKPQPPVGVPPTQSEMWPVNKRTSRFGRVTSVEEHEGGLVVPPGEVIEPAQPNEFADPFAPILKRQPSEELFHTTPEPDKSLLDTLVDDERLKKLWDQIEALHEELVQNVLGDRGATDVYQQELLRASSLLLESRSNYDDARAIVYRIRADLNRQRKVIADVEKYRFKLLNYYAGWGIAWLVLFALKELFAGVAESVGVSMVAAFYHPMLFGVLGALISGYLTLERHTTRLRDFDPIHISWYLFNPLLGGVMGLLMFLLYAVINDDVLEASSTFRLEIAVAWLLCAVAGMNQNSVLRQMNELFKRVGRGNKG